MNVNSNDCYDSGRVLLVFVALVEMFVVAGYESVMRDGNIRI